MSLETSKELLENALKGHYAVPAFNANNLEYIQAILFAATELRSPVIVSAAKAEIDYMDGEVFVAIMKTLASKLPIPISIHLDHGPNYDEVIRCLRYGFTSVMYDGSNLTLKENISNTIKVVEAAHACSVPVEGEIGVIGKAATSSEASDNESNGLADPDMCEQFVHETGIDSLAAAIGNAHGIYIKKPELHFELLKEIKERTNIPLVLHGGTGIPEEDIRTAISLGIAKINFGTIMRKGYIETLIKTLNSDPYNWNLMKQLTPAKQKMIEIARFHIKMCMSDGKA
jgi:fructose-bisphosphate aldolase class II